jgi:ribosomal protein S18 acetylase RimI-like enzyme
MTGAVRIRRAQPDDADFLGMMLVEAGGGVFEILLDGVAPGATPAQIMAEAARQKDGAFSYRNAIIAMRDGVASGSLTAFAANQFGSDESTLIPPDRRIYIDAIRTILDTGSWYIAAMAILPEQRRRHLGVALLKANLAQAREHGFDRVSLHVWTANVAALSLYLRLGFSGTGSTRVPPHPQLHHGESILALTKLL